VRSTENIEKLVKNLDLDIDTNAQTDQVVLSELLDTQKKLIKQQSAYALLNIRRKIMKSPITKLAAAAVIIAVVVLGLFEFINSDISSGVIWADVVNRVQASRGVIYRNRATLSGRPADSDYSIAYLSDTKSRHDFYKGDTITRSFYCDFDAKTEAWLTHSEKKYKQDAMSEQTIQEQHGAWASPDRWIQEFLSRDYKNLGQKTIDGELCEGIETTDPTFGVSTFPVESLVARVWVSVKTGYPVMLEGDITSADDDKMHIKGTLDQFQWDVELNPSIFEPNIPLDYEQM